MKIQITLVILVLASMASITGHSQALKVRTGFGNNGFVKNNIGNDAPNYIYSTATQPDGKIIISGNLLYRVNDEAEIDATFGTNGFIDQTYNGGINQVGVQTDGKIIYTMNYIEDSISILRINSNGTPDLGFNGTGQRQIGLLDHTFHPTRIRTQPDGKILLIGVTQQYEPIFKNKIFVIRLLANGQFDNSFDNDGTLFIELSDYDEAYDIGIQSDGKLVLTGFMYPDVDNSRQLFVIRLSATGSRDMTFNGTGIVQYSQQNSGGEYGHLLQVYPNNKILLAGVSNGNLLLMRLNVNGSYDNTFSGDGMLTQSNGLFNSPSMIHLLAGNSILVTGTTGFYPSENADDFAAFKFSDAGVPDVSFNGSGKTYLPRRDNDHVAGSKVLTDGKILLLGYRDSIPVLTTAKISANGIFDLAYGSNGFKYNIFSPTDEYAGKILPQADGKIVVLIAKSQGVLNKAQGALLRYNTNGTIDNTYGVNGIRMIDSATAGYGYVAGTQTINNKIVCAYFKVGPNSENIMVATRYNANGSIDNTFDASALSALPDLFGSNLDVVSDAAGNIFLAHRPYDIDNNFHIYKLTGSGQLDPGFGDMGKLTLPDALYPNLYPKLALQQNGKLLITGFTISGDLSNYYILRLNSNGQADNSFGINGVYSNPANEATETGVFGLELTKDQKIIVAGYLYEPDDESCIIKVERLLSNGSPDMAFNGTGIQSLSYPTNPSNPVYAYPTYLAIHPDSSLYITGGYDDDDDDDDDPESSYNFIVRLKQNGTIDSALSVDGTGWYNVAGSTSYEFIGSIAIGSDSIIYTCGEQLGFLSDYDYTLRAFKRLPSEQGRVYTFTGNGNWNNAVNWKNSARPPHPLPDGSVIVIDPVANGTSIINVPQTIAPGGSFNVKDGGKVIIQGNLNISN